MLGFNHFGQVALALHPLAVKAVKKACLDAQADMQKSAPRDTGFLANSIYVEFSDSSTYSQIEAPTKKGSYVLPEVEKPENDLTGKVAVGANYGLFVELGTSRMTAQPFFYPAIQRGQSSLDSAMEVLGKGLEAAGVA